MGASCCVCGREHLLPDGEQLELALEDRRVKVPWEGRSPRGLTRVALGFIFDPRGKKKHKRNRDPSQMEMFGGPSKGPPRYGGAPLLLPLPEEKNDGKTSKDVQARLFVE